MKSTTVLSQQRALFDGTAYTLGSVAEGCGMRAEFDVPLFGLFAFPSGTHLLLDLHLILLL
jgi:hypothetical protein